ncbi:outer membrane protein transport protein [Sulfuricurvum sp.]|uniref:OmpP1/FadL family transporter n=1 Tax=Sulfuricurvum sp. TaxID=2025608 RepID=UPI00260DDE67|nr:outer membrane protein transport protein [Sulfuricurvum sp.]MDD3598174.1 outer membrane protein transport protein [Sulfuricurvum sp.]
MKRSIKIAVAAAIALSATSAFATNGDNLIGFSAKSRAMGGTGIANFNGADAALTNPALLAKTKTKNSFSFAGTVFNSDVKVESTAGNASNPAIGVSKTSDEGISMIPSIALSHRINDEVVFGLGMYGTAGMGTDWRGSTGLDNMLGQVDLYNMRSSLMLMQFAPALSYGNDTFGVGVTAIVQYGALSIDYDTSDATHVGSGTSNDFGLGFDVGAYYNPVKELTIGLNYKSAIDMQYKNQISDAAAAFGYGSNPLALPGKSDHLEQPEEYGIGVAYNMGAMTYTMDVKEIKWSDAKGYKDFGWDDQTVYALGVKYSADDFWLGAGFNYGENPIPNNKSTVPVTGNPAFNNDGDTMNLFNYAMFPATVETAYTIGGGYSLDKTMSIDAAFTYTPEVTDTVSAVTVAAGNVTTKHSQNAVTVALNFDF